ncbi:MAG: type II toxin-antitoxin system HicA family toxin [Dehalococcoidales bacterium]|nr:type II toxin-antitoxin system HicA family toxin [Dehalococcoidales bacterium]
MTRLPIVNYLTMEKVLLSFGFFVVRQKGSHVFFRHPDGRTTTIPNHSGRDISRPLLREVLREINLTSDQLLESLRKK